MKQPFLYLAVLLLLLSCNKSKDDSEATYATQRALMAHIWIEDSVGSGKPGVPVVVLTEPKYELQFKADKYYSLVGQNGPVFDSLKYEMNGFNEVYYWADSAQKSTNRYLIITTLTDTSLILSFPSMDQNIEYYHAK